MVKTKIIAEVGVNHNGNLKNALLLVDKAKEIGADFVKFQYYKSDNLVTPSAKLANYQKKNFKVDNQFRLLKKLELSDNCFYQIHKKCKKIGIELILSVFDEEGISLINKLKLNYIKIPSGEITNGPLLLSCIKSRKKIILSTGMSTLNDIKRAIGLFFSYYSYQNKSRRKFIAFDKINLNGKVYKKIIKNITLLHCTSEYPTPYEEVNLKNIFTLKSFFKTNVGLSDHSQGIIVPIAAISMGANFIEKHLTLNKKMKGPDHSASLEPIEFKEMITQIKNIEKSIGSDKKTISKSEKKNINNVRKSIYCHRKIKKGEIFTKDNIIVKRPYKKSDPFSFWNLLGKKAKKDYKKNDLIN